MNKTTKSRNIKPLLKRALIVLLIVGAGFFAGRLHQQIAEGHHFDVLKEKTYDSALGEIRWREVNESFGIPLFNTGTTLIEFGDRTLYKAKRSFQEDVPVARNIQTSGNVIQWDDGEYRFHLTLEKMEQAPTPIAE